MAGPVAEQSHASEFGSEPLDLATSSPQSLHRAVYARRAEYTRPHRIRVKIGSWNVAACTGTDKDLATWFISGKGIDKTVAKALDLSHNLVIETDESISSTGQDPASVHLLGGNKIGLYVLGLQEVVNLNPVTQYVYAEANPTEKWRTALEAALPKGYEFVGSEQMSGLLLLLYASPEVAPSIGNVSTRVVGTGVGGWFGNKGATVARIVLGETTKIAFVNSHLSSGNDAASFERRCWDAKTIMDRTRFDPITRAGDMDNANTDKIGDEDFAFWFGDLNFRLDGIPSDDIRRLLILHTKGEYDMNRSKDSGSLDGEGIIVLKTSESSDKHTDGASNVTRFTDQSHDDDSISLPDPDDFETDPRENPASLQTTLDSLLTHDQLMRMMRERKLFHEGWREGPITFLPSYKYDVGTVCLFDTSEKRRAPSWCDRILYQTKQDRETHQRKMREDEEARKRDDEMKAQGVDHAADDDEVLFDYDPDNDGEAEPSGKPGLDYDEYDNAGDDSGEVIATNDDSSERLHLEIYTSHQRIMSSDHKPIMAIFTLDYDAVVPDLKAKIHSEVARELDRVENEGRPAITIVMDGHGRESGDEFIDFGEVSYLKKTTASLTLANTGRVPATFSFVGRPTAGNSNDSASPQWLKTSFLRPGASDASDETIELGKEVTLETGETVNAILEVFIDKISHARMLNDGRTDLEEVLVLRLTDGRDHFLPVRATWAATCIGRSIDELIRVPDGGIRVLVKSLSEKSSSKRHVGSIPYDLEVKCAAPKELFKLTEALGVLIERTLADEQMLESCQIPRNKPGWPFEDFVAGSRSEHLPAVIDVLDNDKPIAEAFAPEVPSILRLETVADASLLFLQGLTDGVINMPLWSKIEQAPIQSLGQGQTSSTTPTPTTSFDAAEDEKNAILDILANAPHHNIAFVFLMATLAKVVAELAPVTKGDLDALKAIHNSQTGGAISAIGAIGRRSISFRRSTGFSTTGTGTPVADAIAASDRRKTREKRVAEIFGKVVCRVPLPVKEKERKALEEKRRVVVELFLRRREDE